MCLSLLYESYRYGFSWPAPSLWKEFLPLSSVSCLIYSTQVLQWYISMSTFSSESYAHTSRAVDFDPYITEAIEVIEAGWQIYEPLNWVIIISCSGLSHIRCKAIIWIIADLLSIVPFGTNFGIIMETQTFSLTKMYLKTSSANSGHFASA